MGKHTKNRRFIKDVLDEIKDKSTCEICGGDKDLTFHHRDASTKVFSLGAGRETSMLKVIRELRKCDILCVECHKELHRKEDIGYRGKLQKINVE